MNNILQFQLNVEKDLEKELEEFKAAIGNTILEAAQKGLATYNESSDNLFSERSISIALAILPVEAYVELINTSKQLLSSKILIDVAQNNFRTKEEEPVSKDEGKEVKEKRNNTRKDISKASKGRKD